MDSDKIWTLREDIATLDFKLGIGKKEFRRDFNPMDVLARKVGYRPELDLIGWLCGVGLVFVQKEELTVAVGPRQSIVFWKRFWDDSKLRKKSPKSDWFRADRILDLKYFYEDKNNLLWTQGREMRLERLRTFHKACEVFPDLRDWNAPKPPEISLHQNHESLRIGGILADPVA